MILADGGSIFLWWGLYALVGLAAIVAAFVVTWMVVATIVLGIVRFVRGPADPDLG